ncbi:MAG: HAD-IIIA family hydrolase [Sulfuricaulis sp.]|uniref:HAD-IIIA family hydrolase n=1 Tax=Sulfuricaulis sp. TaxID=2003553 RepID=UPI0025DB052A|nr:HAD-IIIA family hydrolase [Sulfuricaulis sp.]MCR4345907.1 HAD-IIIA family hydrolase [Sulfuricaulis sp.]
MKPRYELIIFDWDGTLMDSVAKIVRCFTAAVDDVGAPHPGQDATRHVIGLGLAEAVATLLPQVDADTRTQVVERYRQYFLHLDQTDMPLFPGVREGLESLVAQGCMLAIATGKARRGLDRVLHDTGMAHLFCATRCADEAFSKPHPRMLEDILEQTGFSVEQALMVGDTTYDMQMARHAGMDSLAVTYGVHGRELLVEHAPLVCLDSFSEVYAWLQQANGLSSAAATN